MTFCVEVGGIRFYDDSKATNVGSVIGSLSGWDSSYVLLLGGRHKAHRMHRFWTCCAGNAVLLWRWARARR
jgi:UDP-N-acetylmuramoylalanine--D-glutamate ligase